MKWWDYLVMFTFVILCFAFCGVMLAKSERDSKRIEQFEQEIQSYHEEIKDLREEISDYRKEQNTIVDCVLSGKW